VTLLTLEDARDALRYCNSYSRMPTLIDLERSMRSNEWHTVLGEEWSGCDNVGRHRLLLRQMLPVEGPVTEMMTAEELDAHRALPERLTVYRGCGPKNMRGASWSLEREVAERFPTLNRYQQAQPMLVTAKVSKRGVLAVKLDRGEAEIVTFSARRVAVEPLLAVVAA
jgi:hypothetical protein